MADLKTVTDITIADRLTTKLKHELTISEIAERAAKLEEELNKFKTTIDPKINGKEGRYAIEVTVNGVTKAIEFTNQDVEHYISSSNPSHQITVDAVDVLIDPYRQMLYGELLKIIAPIVSNYQDVKAGRKL
jgi:hypothetical protein